MTFSGKDADAHVVARGRVPVHVAIVQSGHRICHLVVDTTPEGLTRQLAEYVRHAAGYQLWPCDAQSVESLLADGKLAEAVALYFARTGERWDRESLDLRLLHLALDPVPAGGDT